MTNPYGSDHAENHINETPNDDTYKDYRWEDGWELLWINLGMHFNGDPLDDPSSGTYFATGNYSNDPNDPEITPEIAPSNIPYFVIYNRYRGTLRLFANVWQDNLNTSFQRVVVTMKYTDLSDFNGNITGLFRHASQIDRALNQTTEFIQMAGPRLQPVNSSDWMVAEFQMAFDPCVCMKEFDGNQDPGKIEFVFETIESLKIDMLSRTIELESAIDSALINEDFLNLSQFDSIDYRPGSRMYNKMQDLLNAYQRELDFYNDSLADYESSRNDIVDDLFDASEQFIVQGITSALTDLLSGGSLDIFKVIAESTVGDTALSPSVGEDIKDLLKGFLGIGTDQLNMELFGKEDPIKPQKPTQPVANFSETNYRGTITKTFYQRTPPLLVPGGIDSYEPTPNNYVGYGKMRLSPRNFPAYNKVLGQVALLENIEPSIYADSDFSILPDSFPGTAAGIDFDFKLKIDSLLKIALNRTLDFDLDKTRTLVNVELIMENADLENASGDFTQSIVESNMYRTHAFPQDNGRVLYQYNSKWVSLELLNQYVFSLHVRDTYDDGFNNITVWPGTFLHKFKSLKIKLMHDMYFDQVNTWDQQNNSTQVYSYVIYDFETPVDPWLFPGIFTSSSTYLSQYTAGDLLLADDTITTNHPLVHSISGDTLFINAENIFIEGDISVQSGYILVIQALNQINISPDSILTPDIILRIKRDFYDTPVFDYVSNSDVYNFCNNSSQYQANVASAALMSQIGAPTIESEPETLPIFEKTKTFIKIYPNPASSELTIQSQGNGIDRLTLFDAATRPVIQKIPNGANLYQLNISNLSPGVYIVRADCGGEILSEKLVVTK